MLQNQAPSNDIPDACLRIRTPGFPALANASKRVAPDNATLPLLCLSPTCKAAELASVQNGSTISIKIPY